MSKLSGFFVLCCFCVATAQQNTYRAAVLEHAPKQTPGYTVKQNFDDNIQEYINYIQQAAYHGVQILVFPEDGLTGWATEPEDFEDVSTQVPDPQDKVSPCHTPGNYAKFLVDLSCAVRRHRIYAVVNLIEWHYATNGKGIYRNTNVVLDRNGVAIVRYRKINLFDEPHYEPGPHVVSTFTTDFGVTFGTLICSDILFKTPSVTILADPSVTDVVYSAAWFSEIPFYAPNSVQHGYATANGVNLLAAGMNYPSERSGGSGIYLADGRIIQTYISGVKGSKLIIAEVPILKTRKNVLNSCQASSDMPSEGYHAINTNLFPTMRSDIDLFTFKTLTLKEKITEKICGGTSYFCCEFDIMVNTQSLAKPNYVYKLVAYYGVSKISQTKTIGESNCALIACFNETNESCGLRNLFSPTGITFESITVKGIFDRKNTQYRPSTLKSDLLPTTNYMYCTKTMDDNAIEVNMKTTKSHNSLLTFGIFGRVFSNDDKIPGPINRADIHVSCAYLILGTVFLVLGKLILAS